MLVVITNSPRCTILLPAAGRIGIYSWRLDAGYACRSPGSVCLESAQPRRQRSDFACGSASVARQPPHADPLRNGSTQRVVNTVLVRVSEFRAEKEVCGEAAFAWPGWSSGAEKRHSSARSRLIRPSHSNRLALRFLLILSLSLLRLRLVARVARVPQCLFVSHVNSF